MRFCGDQNQSLWRAYGLGNHSLFGVDPQLVGVDVPGLFNVSVRERSPARLQCGFHNFKYGLRLAVGPTGSDEQV